MRYVPRAPLRRESSVHSLDSRREQERVLAAVAGVPRRLAGGPRTWRRTPAATALARRVARGKRLAEGRRVAEDKRVAEGRRPGMAVHTRGEIGRRAEDRLLAAERAARNPVVHKAVAAEGPTSEPRDCERGRAIRRHLRARAERPGDSTAPAATSRAHAAPTRQQWTRAWLSQPLPSARSEREPPWQPRWVQRWPSAAVELWHRPESRRARAQVILGLIWRP